MRAFRRREGRSRDQRRQQPHNLRVIASLAGRFREVEPGIDRMGALWVSLEQFVKNRVGLGRLSGIDQRPAPLCQQGLTRLADRFQFRQPVAVREQVSIDGCGLGRMAGSCQQPGLRSRA